MAELSPEKIHLTPTKPSVAKGEAFWLAVFESMEGIPKIDFDKLADRCGYKNAATARVMFHNKRRALQQASDPIASPIKGIDLAVDGIKPKRGRKPKSKEDMELGAPAKKRGRGRPRKSEMMVSIKSSDSGDEEADTDIDY